MESLKGWFRGLHKPLQLRQKDQTLPQVGAESKTQLNVMEHESQPPTYVRTWFQQVFRPVYDVVNDDSSDIASSLLRENGSARSVNRDDGRDQRSDELEVKRPGLQDELPLPTATLDGDREINAQNERSSEASKRRRSSSSVDGCDSVRSVKRAKTAVSYDPKCMNVHKEQSGETDAGTTAKASALQVLDSDQTSFTIFEPSKELSAARKFDTNIRESSISHTMLSGSDMLLRARTSHRPTALRVAAEKYFRSRVVPESSDPAQRTGTFGVSLWPGSNAIPGAGSDPVQAADVRISPAQQAQQAIAKRPSQVSRSRACRSVVEEPRALLIVPNKIKLPVGKRNTYATPVELMQRPKITLNPLKTQRKLVGLWGRSVGPLMEPVTWTS